MPHDFTPNYDQLVRLGSAMMSIFGPLACDDDKSPQDEGEIVGAAVAAYQHMAGFEHWQRADVTIAMNRVSEHSRGRPLVRVGGVHITDPSDWTSEDVHASIFGTVEELQPLAGRLVRLFPVAEE